jgi:hypothetical protein
LAFIAPISSSKIDVAVLAEIGDALARPDTKRDQRIRNAVGVDVEFGEAGLAPLEFVSQRVAKRLGAGAHHVGEVSRLLRSGHVSPVSSCFRYAELASSGNKDNMFRSSLLSCRTTT